MKYPTLRLARPCGWSWAVGFDYAHVAFDDYTRFACAEVLPDEKGPTFAEVLTRAEALRRSKVHRSK